MLILVIQINLTGAAITKDTKAEDGTLRNVYCGTVKEIQDALRNAKAGDKIIIKEGSYQGTWMTSGYFYSAANGTEENTIIIESENSDKPSELKGLRDSSGYVLYLTGDYWIVNNLKITYGQKGIMIDNGNNNIINNCEIYDVQQEGVHFRDGSSNNLLVNSWVHNTGTARPDFGEGVYVGSDKGKWTEFKKECDNNIIRGCTIGPYVGAEHVDIKEGTTGTIVEDSVFKGTGISGKNYADSFIDVKGNKAIIRDNKSYRENNPIIVDAFQIHVQVDGWGEENEFYNNDLYLDNKDVYVLNNSKGTAKVWNNRRYPEGNMYKGNNEIIDGIEYELEDVNKDGEIDILDLTIISSAYNLSKNDELFNVNLDINRDDVIDIFDIVKVARRVEII